MTNGLSSFSLSPLNVLKMESQREVCSLSPAVLGTSNDKKVRRHLSRGSGLPSVKGTHSCPVPGFSDDGMDGCWSSSSAGFLTALLISELDHNLGVADGTSLPFAVVGLGPAEMDHQVQAASSSTPWLPSSLPRPFCQTPLHLGDSSPPFPELVNPGTQDGCVWNETQRSLSAGGGLVGECTTF